MRIGIVGMGWVGSSVAISTLHAGLARELLLNDAKTALAEGEALDLAHGDAFYPPADVRAVTLEDMADADALVIAAGRGSHPGETRLDLLRENAAIVSAIASRLSSMRGILIVVTNPLDVMTLVAQRASGLPPARVIGTGTMLDSARLRYLVGQEIGVEPRSVHAYVVGEHGDSSVPLWSSARVGGSPLRAWPGWDASRERALADRMRRAAYEIISRKGATNHAIGLVTANLLRSVLRDERRVLTVSRVQEGAFGVRQLAISLPGVVGITGAAHVIEPDLSADERVALERSVSVLTTAAAQLNA